MIEDLGLPQTYLMHPPRHQHWTVGDKTSCWVVINAASDVHVTIHPSHVHLVHARYSEVVNTRANTLSFDLSVTYSEELLLRDLMGAEYLGACAVSDKRDRY